MKEGTRLKTANLTCAHIDKHHGNGDVKFSDLPLKFVNKITPANVVHVLGGGK